MLLNATVIYCVANVAGYLNGDPDYLNFSMVVDDILWIEQSLKIECWNSISNKERPCRGLQNSYSYFEIVCFNRPNAAQMYEKTRFERITTTFKVTEGHLIWAMNDDCPEDKREDTRSVLCSVAYDSCAQWYTYMSSVLEVECWFTFRYSFLRAISIVVFHCSITFYGTDRPIMCCCAVKKFFPQHNIFLSL